MSVFFELVVGASILAPAIIFTKNSFIHLSAVHLSRKLRDQVLDDLVQIVDDPAVSEHARHFSSHLAILATNDEALRIVLRVGKKVAKSEKDRADLFKGAGKHKESLRRAICLVTLMAIAHDPQEGKSVRRTLRSIRVLRAANTPREVKKSARDMSYVVTNSIELEMKPQAA